MRWQHPSEGLAQNPGNVDQESQLDDPRSVVRIRFQAAEVQLVCCIGREARPVRRPKPEGELVRINVLWPLCGRRVDATDEVEAAVVEVDAASRRGFANMGDVHLALRGNPKRLKGIEKEGRVRHE